MGKRVAAILLMVMMCASSIYATSYYYDDLNRLIRVEYDSGVCIQYQYDQAGNIVKVITTGGKQEGTGKTTNEDSSGGAQESPNNKQDKNSGEQLPNNQGSQTNTQKNREENKEGNKEGNKDEKQESNENKNQVIFSLNQKVLWLNGEKINIDTATYISKNNRLMVPVRYMAYALNISQDKIKWDKNSRVITILGEKKIEITIGQPYMLVDSKKVMLNECAAIKDGRTFLPIGDICGAFGLQYLWDNKQKQLTVYSKR